MEESVSVHLERSGGEGKPIVFIHGAGGSGLEWRFQNEYLKGAAEVILVDLPGHGKALGPGRKSVEEYRDACLQALSHAGFESCVLAGHSMGGAVAMSCALARPETILGLVLIGTGARLRVLPAILEGIRQDKEGTLRMIVEYAFSGESGQDIKEAALREMLGCSAEVIYNDFFACDHFDVMGRLGGLRTPALIACGAEDRLTPPAYSRYLHQEIPGSRLVLIKGAGHMVMLEKPAELNEAISEFLRGT